MRKWFYLLIILVLLCAAYVTMDADSPVRVVTTSTPTPTHRLPTETPTPTRKPKKPVNQGTLVALPYPAPYQTALPAPYP